MSDSTDGHTHRLAVLLGLVAFGFFFFARHGHVAQANNYVLLADAWLHGHSWVRFTTDTVDVVPLHGRAYVVEGPAPAILLLPFVAVFGSGVNQSIICNAVGGVGVFGIWLLCTRLGIASPSAGALTAFAVFGTSFYTAAANGEVWMFAHVVACTFSILAIGECLGRKRGWLVAIYALLAAFSRFPLVTALPLYAIALALEGPTRRSSIAFVATLVPGFILSIWYDLARWGTIADPGFAYWFEMIDERSKMGVRLFSLANASTQLRQFLFRFPTLVKHPPFLVCPPDGFSILATSAPFAYAVFAGRSTRTLLLAVATLATAIPAFTYYDSGQYQFGMRHALDFEPFLFALLACAVVRRPSRAIDVALIVFAAFGFVEGTLWLHPLHRS